MTKLAFSRQNQQFLYDFSADPLTSDGGVLLLARQLKKSGLINFFNAYIPDRRDPRYVTYPSDQLLRLRTLLLCCGYEDANDVEHLEDDPALVALCDGALPSQPTISRWENALNMGDMYRLAEAMIHHYVEQLQPDREYVIIDMDCTDDPTHGKQQGSLFHGYYWQHMYNQLFYLDGDTGQVILPVLRPGNVHSSKWNERFLRRIVQKIRDRFPHMVIHLRADAGFSGPAFYELAAAEDLNFCVGISGNPRLMALICDQVEMVAQDYVQAGIPYQHFVGPFSYQADSWAQPQEVYAKIESTGKGLNIRFFVSKYEVSDPKDLYRNYYVLRGEAAENRIKDIKNFCYSDRLSCHGFSANYYRLILSCLAYEVLRSIRQRLPALSKDPAIRRWSIESIRLKLLKVAAYVQVRVRRVYFRFARGHPYRHLFDALMQAI